MIRRYISLSAAVLCSGLLAMGCQSSGDQPSGTGANSTPSMAESAKNAGKKAIEPKSLMVPADTVLYVVLDQTISSKTAESPVEIEGKVPIPKGAGEEGVIKDAKAPGHFKGGAILELALTSVPVN